MKRTTVTLPDDLALVLDQERRRQDTSTGEIVRRALRSYLIGEHRPKRLGFIGIARSEQGNLAANAEIILAQEWADAICEDSGLRPAVSPADSGSAEPAGSSASEAVAAGSGDEPDRRSSPERGHAGRR